MGAATADPEPSQGSRPRRSRIIAQINSIDTQVSAAVERWNLANVKLARIQRDLQRSRHELGVSKVNLKRAQADLARQAVSVYTSTDSNSTIEVLLGATSLDDLLGRLDTASRVSDQRSSVVGDVLSFRTHVHRLAVTLQRAQTEQQQIVARRAAERAAIQAQLAERTGCSRR